MKRITFLAVTVAVSVGTVGALVAGTSAARPSARTAAAVVSVRSTKLGKVLVDSRGVTLYLFEKDRRGRSACSGACAQAWPPLLTKGKPRARGGARASELGTTRRTDGTVQVTYAHHPLYTYVGDRGRAGSTAGEGSRAFGAEWYVLGSNGRKIEKGGS